MQRTRGIAMIAVAYGVDPRDEPLGNIVDKLFAETPRLPSDDEITAASDAVAAVAKAIDEGAFREDGIPSDVAAFGLIAEKTSGVQARFVGSVLAQLRAYSFTLAAMRRNAICVALNYDEPF